MRIARLIMSGMLGLSVLGSAAAHSAPNQPPTISGTPATSVVATQTYSFTPSASDPDSRTLYFLVSNKPSWASFSSSTGQLSGSPTSSQVGTYSNIIISVKDRRSKASLPAFSITVVPGTTNSAPTIGGSPATSVTAGSAYTFTPTASDPDGNTLGFSIAHKPAWASFSIASGRVSGTPSATQVGTYPSIVISVSDGTSSRSLPTFGIDVTNPEGGSSTITNTGTATLGWYAPTTNTDGTALTDLAGFRLYHGTSASALTDVRTVSSPGITTYVFDQLATGTHYFAISALNSAGTEGVRSAVGSKLIP